MGSGLATGLGVFEGDLRSLLASLPADILVGATICTEDQADY
jgi:hypothetical protein